MLPFTKEALVEKTTLDGGPYIKLLRFFEEYRIREIRDSICYGLKAGVTFSAYYSNTSDGHHSLHRDCM